MAKKRRIVSIEIGTHSVKAAHLEQRHEKDEIVITHGAVVEYAEREPVGREMQATANSIEAAINTLEIPRKTPLVLSISRALLTTRRIDGLPIDGLADSAKLANIVAFQAEDVLPFATEDVVFDHYNPIEKSKALSVELVATRRTDMEKVLAPLKAINATPQAVIPAMVATSKMAEQSDGAIVIDIGAGWSDLSILKNGKIVFSRSFPLGGDQLTLSLINEISSSKQTDENEPLSMSKFDMNEDRKRDLLIPINNDELSKTAVGKWCQRLTAEIQRSIAAFQQDEANATVMADTVLLTGGGSRLGGLANYLTKSLSISTHVWDISSRLQALGITHNNDFSQLSDQLAVVVGQGFAFLNNTVDLDLLPKPEKQQIQRVDQQRRILLRTAAGIGVVALLAVGALSWGQYQQAQVNVVEQQLQKLRSNTNRAKTRLNRELVVAELMTPRLSALDLLREFSLRLGDRTKVALTTFQLTNLNDLIKARLNFNVEANSHQDISNLITALNQSGIFKDLKQGQIVSVKKDRKNIFQVQITCSIKAGAVKTLSEHRYLGTGLQASSVNQPKTNENNGENWQRDSNGEENRSESNSDKTSSSRRKTKSESLNEEIEQKAERREKEKAEWREKEKERERETRKDQLAKEILPSVEEYERMSDEEQAEVRAAKERIGREYDQDD